ncbi:MAG: uroporphyrinogen-III synthase, partial [Burkholderiales bacterium]
MSGALAGRRIVITRPAGQVETLAEMIRADGGTPIVFPVIEIRDVADVQPLAELVDRLDDFDVAIFISANAVAKAMNLVQSRRAWPAHVRVATIGKGSEKALRRFGFAEIDAPTGRFDSEALLELATLTEVVGKR